MKEIKEIRKVADLKSWDRNPRKIKSADFERLKRQITKFGQYKPLLINQEGVVLGGNMRLRAYKEMGIKSVWVSVVVAKTDKEMLEYALSDNDRAGEYDQDVLADLMIDIPDLDLSDYGSDIEKITHKFEPNDKDVPFEEAKDPFVKIVHCPKCQTEIEVVL